MVLAGVAVYAVGSQGVHASSSGGCFVGAPVNGGSGVGPTPTSTGSTGNYILRCSLTGNAAQAEFQQTDSTGCILTTVDIFASDSVTRTSSSGTTVGNYLFVGIYQYGLYTNPAGQLCPSPSNMLSGYGEVANVQYHGDPGLSNTSVSGTVPFSGVDWTTGNAISFDVPVDLTWKGVGQSTRTVDSQHWQSPDLVQHFHETSTTRSATTSGTITVNGTNYASIPTIGGLSSVDSGQFDLTHQ
jgi:hypothetical protein